MQSSWMTPGVMEGPLRRLLARRRCRTRLPRSRRHGSSLAASGVSGSVSVSELHVEMTRARSPLMTFLEEEWVPRLRHHLRRGLRAGARAQRAQPRPRRLRCVRLLIAIPWFVVVGHQRWWLRLQPVGGSVGGQGQNRWEWLAMCACHLRRIKRNSSVSMPWRRRSGRSL